MVYDETKLRYYVLFTCLATRVVHLETSVDIYLILVKYFEIMIKVAKRAVAAILKKVDVDDDDDDDELLMTFCGIEAIYSQFKAQVYKCE